MNANHFKGNGSDERKREFKRQQDRLKMMAPDTERKAVSADDMINSLLEKSDTFKKVSDDLPHWVLADSPLCCPFYMSIWNLVRCSDKMVDTQAISQLLLTSELHPDVLCFIWNLANKTVPGQLTKQELFIVLALVGLAQSNCTFNNIGVLKLVPSAPIPRLRVAFQPTAVSAHNTGHSSFDHLPSASISPVLPNSSAPATSFQSHLPSLVTTPMYSVPSLSTAAPTAYGFRNKSPSPAANINSINQLSSTTQQIQIIDDDFQDFQSGVLPSQNLSIASAEVSNPPIIPSQEARKCQPAPSGASLDSLTHPEQQFPADDFLSPSALGGETFQNSIDSITSDLLASSFIEKTFPKVSNFPKSASTFVEAEKDDTRKGEVLNLSDSFTEFQSDPVDDFSEFQDFKSAQLDTEIIQPSKGVIPKLPSFYKVSPESERKLRNLSQPESLSAMPESKISSRNQVSSMPSIAVLGGTPQGLSGYSTPRDVGSRLANHSVGLKTDKNRHHHKHYKIKPIVSGSTPGIPEEMFPKVPSKPPGSFLLKETKIPSTELDREPPIPELTRSIEIPIVGTFKETTLPVDMKIPTVEKASYILGDTWITSEAPDIAENSLSAAQTAVDKYSALRDLEEPVASEDFGEFLSAELTSEKAVEAWNTWNKSVNLPEDGIVEPSESLRSSQSGYDYNLSLPTLLPESESTKTIKPPESIDLLGDSFDLTLPITPLNEKFLPISTSVNTYLIDQSLQPKADEDFSGSYDAENIDEFGDFVGPSVETLNLPPTEDVTSIKSRGSSENSDILRDDPLSSFDFRSDKVISGHAQGVEGATILDVRSGVEHQEVASKCLQCCHDLLREAVQIFEGIADKSILKEVLATSEARNYLKYLQIVYRISQRVSLAGNGDNLTTANEISQLWVKLGTITSEYSISFPAWDEHEERGMPCVVCKGPTSDHDIHHNGLHYHVSCANLWVNCIETSLPCF